MSLDDLYKKCGLALNASAERLAWWVEYQPFTKGVWLSLPNGRHISDQFLNLIDQDIRAQCDLSWKKCTEKNY